MKTGIELIAEERQRQIEKEGWTPEHDDTHNIGELAWAAACYCEQSVVFAKHSGFIRYQSPPPPSRWPWDEEFWKPKNRERDLVRAGALIAAEIDRLQRLELKTNK